MLECISPQASTGLARVDLSLGDKSCFSASSITYEFHPRIIIAVAVPSKGGTIGQLPVRVYGAGISRRASRLQHLRCKFGNLTTRARLEPSGSEVECKTPPGRPGFVQLELTNNLIDYSRSNQVFEYEMVLLAGIAPNRGPTSGGTAVIIAGSGLLSFAHFDTWCTFGTAEATLVNFLSSTSVSCTSPSMTAAGPVSVGLHAGGMATLEAVTFNFVHAIAVVSLHPLMGPTRGGTTILVDGLHFSASSWCRFDTSLVPARFLSSTRLQCESPAHAASVTHIAISSNGVDFSASELRYEYLVPAVLLSAFPDSGPTDGGTFVTLRGDFLSERAASLMYLHCRFNLTMVPAAFVSTKSVTCYTMEMGSGIASVATTNNLRDYTEGVVFRYHMVRMTRALPLSGPTLGGTRVHISGGPFNVGDVLCHFGTHATGGRSLSVSSIICTSPVKGLGPGPVTLRITSAEATYTSTLTFVYVGEYHVRKLSPRAGPAAGGTTVTLQGVGISASSALCKFDGTALIPRRWSDERVGCVSPRSLAPTLISVRVAGQDDGVRAWHEAVVFMVAPTASVAHLQPAIGPVGGGTVVLLIGRFPFSTMSETAAFCHFNRTIVPGTIVLPTLVRCRTPVALVPGYVGVEVTGNLVDFSHDGLLFSYESVQLLALSPSSGPAHGQTRVSLSGYGFLAMRGIPSRALMCDFEGIVQPATLQDSSTVSCFAPAQREYPRLVVRLLAEDCNSAPPSGVQYTYYDGLGGSSLLPILGPTTAGTTVQVLGSHMKATGQLFCKFQSVATSAAHVVVAVWQSKSRVDCVSPAMPLAGQAWVEVSSNGQNFSSSKLVFEYHLPTSITSVRPSQAPVEGGMLLTIRGRHFSQRGSVMGSLRCSFGWTVREATFESSTALLCRSPPSAAGFQAVEVSNNAVDFTNDRQGLEFIRISLARLFPTAGPARGGTTITLIGGAFPPGEYMCQFNGLEGLAARISSTVLRCNTPSMRLTSQQQAVVSLRFNNVTLSVITSFLFYRPPKLLGLHPPAGPEGGGTMLTLLGQALEASTLAWCKFAHYSTTGQPLALVVPAHRVSAFQLGCVTPVASSLGPHLVELSFNEQQYTASQHLFTYQPALLLRRLLPAKGPTRGETLVHVMIRGAGSIDHDDELACVFNSTMVHASLRALDTVHCRAPSHSSGVVLVSLAANRVSMSSIALEFEFQTMSILRLRPSYGPVSGGTRVVVQGAHFPVGRIKCRFGSASGLGEAESPDTLGCVSPPYSTSNIVQLGFGSAEQNLVNGLDFRFHDDGEVVARLLPQAGPLDGGTLIRIAVRNVYNGNAEGLLCRFGADGTVPALWVTQDEVECVAPAVRRAQSVLVVVAPVNSGFSPSTAGVFVYERPWRPTSVVPTKGGVQGGTMLNVTGTRFPLRSAVIGQLVCNVNDTVVAATRHSLQLLSCQAPAHAAGYVTVDVTGSLHGLIFEYLLVGQAGVETAAGPVAGITLIQLRVGSSLATPIAATSPLDCTGARLLVCQARTTLPTSISSSGALLAKEAVVQRSVRLAVSPSAGPQAGGTKVTVSTEDVFNDQLLFCRFGTRGLVPGRVLSPALFECVAPKQQEPCAHIGCTISVNINSGNGAQQLSAVGTTTFMYHPELHVARVWPTHGPSQGGTAVEVWGTGFKMGKQILCRFSHKTVAASVVDGNRAWCRTPPMSEGHSTLEVSTNGVDFTNQGCVYKYVAVGALQTRPSFGPVRGGADVLLIGHHFVPGHLACKVGESTNTIKAYFESTSVVSIRMGGGVGPHRARVELVGVDGEPHSSGSFTFVSALQVDISPLCGPLRGGTWLTISGVEHGMDLFCHFATAAAGKAGILRWVGPNRRVCVTPAWPTAELTSVRTALAPGGVFTSSSSATFKYVDDPRLHGVHPSTGPDKGGTIVVLQTSNLAGVCPGSRLRCLFNRTEVPATIETPVQIVCSAPKHVAGFVHVGVTSGSTLDMNSQLMFRFVGSPLPRLTPTHGPTRGQTTICVHGVPTSSAPWCVFGDLVTQGAPCSHCAFQSAICCSLPPRTRPNAVRVRFALHGVTTLAHSFRYLDAAVHTVAPNIGPSEGGTLVTIRGHNFDQIGRTFCAFGAQLRVARVVSRTMLTCHSPVGREDRRLQVVISGHSLRGGHIFAYFKPSTLRSGPNPSSSPVTGGTIITTTLGNLPTKPAGLLRCVFGRTHVIAIFDGVKVACSSPAHEPREVAFETAFVGHAMQHPEARATFEYRSFRVPVLRPTSGPIRGGTLLVVSGGRWESSEILGCSFGGAYTSAQLLAPTRLACFSPEALQQGMAMLTVWLDGAVLHRLQFWHHEDPSIERMHPLTGPNQGGTSITLAGRNFQRQEARCRFGDITVVAAWEVGPSALSCTVPAGETGMHRLELTFNGLDFAAAKSFDMHPQLRVHASAPLCGPVDGGTRLLVDVGRALRSERALCRFEGTAVLAVVLDSTMIECRTPGHSAGYKALDISTNLQDFESTGVLFQYLALRSPLRVWPSSGPHNGGTLLTIAMHLQCPRQVWCLFGANRSPQLARQQSTSYLTCVTPRQEGPAATMLRVMVDGDTNSPLLLYQYQTSITIDSVHPPIGITDGATRVEIIGRNFRHGTDIRCAFDAVHVSPQWLSPQSMACIAPPAPVGAVSLHLVDLQGNALTQNAASFQYSTRPTLTALLPAYGTSQGGTLVNVQGVHFLRRAATMSLLTCKFNATVVPASFVDDGMVQCVSPAHAAGSAFVASSNNRQDFSVQEITFRYGVHVSHVSFETRRQPGSTLVDLRSQVDFISSQLTCVLGGQETPASSITPSWIRCTTSGVARTGLVSHDMQGQHLIKGTHVADLMAVVPPTGPSAGGQVVAVFGRGFRNAPQLRCSFGGVVVRAEFVSSEVVNCTTPARGAGDVQRVEVALYGGAFSASELWYEYRLAARITTFGTPSSGSTSVVVLGRRLSSQISCASLFEGLHPIWVGSNEVLCAKLTRDGGQSKLGNMHANVDADAQQSAAPFVTAMVPSEGPELGGTVVTLSGGNFPRTVGCIFGSMRPVLAQWQDSARITCLTPPHDPEGVQFQVLTPTGQMSHESRRFKYTPMCSVLSVVPSRGTSSGGYRLVVSGHRFVDRVLTVRLGRQSVIGTLVDQSTVECIAPPNAAGPVLVELDFALQGRCRGGVPFVFENVTVLSVYPPFGPENGGTTLIVQGGNFGTYSYATCILSRGLRSVARVASTSRLECTAPPSAIGVVTLSISTRDHLSLAASSFEYQAAATVSTLLPSRGGSRGGTIVAVQGQHFSERSAHLFLIGCRFNLTLAVATFSAATAILCESPSVRTTGDVSLEMANNMADFTTDGYLFEYVSALLVSRIAPTHGPVHGGTRISLFGSHFDRNGRVLCRFAGATADASFQSPGQLTCLTPAKTVEGDTVSIILDGVGAQGHHVFSYFTPPVVSALVPPCGPRWGGTQITVQGAHLPMGRTAVCRFDDVLAPAVPITRELLNCTAPAHAPGLVKVEVSGDGLGTSSSTATFYYHDVVELGSLQPALVAAGGVAVLRVTGRNILPGSACLLEGQEGASGYHVWISSSELLCKVAMPTAAGEYRISVSVNMQQAAQEAVTIRIVEPWQVEHIEPEAGPVHGGTVIRITGGRFPPGPQLLCRIGRGTPVAARWLSATHVACVTRPHPPGLAVVGVTGNGQDYSEGVARFEYVAAAAVLALSPRHGPVGGGTLVALRGGPFSARAGALGRMLCRFGRSLSAARLVSGHVTECVSPPHSPAEVHVQLTMNGLDFTQDDVRFSYRGPTILSMHPTLGPELGGTPIWLQVTFIPAAGSLQCRFGLSTPVVASRLNSSHILCASPLHAIGVTNVRLSTGGREWPDLRGPSYEFHGEIHVHHLVPSMGSALGGDLITVIGANFVDGGAGMRCRFGDVSSSAALVNASAIACMTPRQPAVVAPVEVSMNGYDFTESKAEFIFTGWSIHSISPRRGPTAGGTLVTVEMQGMAHSSAEWMCRFGSAQLVSAARLPHGALQCLSPAQPAVAVVFEVIAMGVKEARAMATFDYFEEPRVVHAFPRRVFQNGVPLIYVQGTRFFNSTSLTCAFGTARTNATFVNNRSVACIAPHTSETGLHRTEVQVRVSMNGQDYTSTMAAIDVVACPNGASCLATQSLPCAPGAQCIGQLGSNQTQCPAGTYQPEGGRSSCIPCARGSFCPAPGRSAPKQCVAGMVCSLQGLAFPDQLCPAGHFCPPGVQTSNPESQVHLERPLACPENTWCAAGVATNISEVGNFRTPQPCLSGFVCFRGSASPQGSGPCPTGYYCPPNSLPIACTYANYCPGVGNIFPSQCTPGFYNDRRGRNACIECSIGHICPLAGLKNPVICPAGSVCNVPGLKVPAGLCPAGYLCWEGTETKDWNAETLFKPIPCKEATYCLGGITNNITNENDYASPQPCPHGHYCKEASTTPFGTGRCPAGFFCPKGTSDPFPAPAGYFCKGEGNSMAAPCLPGTWAKYNPHNGTDTCDMCPAGYSCEREGTFAPRPCLPGSYRQFNATISCQLCPEGSWNPFYTNPLESLCLPCPEGRVCPIKGMTNVTQSQRCPEGYICGFNTTSNTQFSTLCPAGFWCDFETKNSHRGCAADKVTQEARAGISEQMEGPDDDICNCLDTCGRIERQDGKRCYCPMGFCPAGSLCRKGTKFSQSDLTPCPVGYYCPEGTSPDDLYRFKCPNGTRSGPGKARVTDCERSGLYVTNALSREMFGGGEPLYETQDEAEFAQQHVASLEKDPFKNSRYGDPMYATGERRALRQLQEESTVLQYLTEPPELVTFKLSPFTMARFTFDYLRVPTEMIYDDHFRIAIFVNGHTQPEPYPPSFWFNPPAVYPNALYPEYKEYRWSKTGLFALHLHALRELNFRVELQILHGLFSESIDAFVGTMSLEIFDSTRANALSMSEDGVRKMLFAAVEKDATFAPPLNLPRIRPDPRHYPGATYLLPHMQENLAAVLEHAALNGSAEVLLDPLEGTYSVALSGDDYWGTRLMVAPMNYLPYFSHCGSGVKIGAPSSGDFSVDITQAFSIGNRNTGPARRRGSLVKCICRNRNVWFPECPPPEGASKYNPGDCSPAGTSQGEIAFKIKQFPNLGANSPRDDQLLLNGDFVVPDGCVECEAAGHGPGTPYPNIRPERVPGWDSHGLFFWVYENPAACELVPPEETLAISQFTWGAVSRFSDTCDYIMQCMYEENTVIKLDKPFWFNGMQDDVIFYLTQYPAPTALIEEGFCFPDTPGDTDRDCKGNAYFRKVQNMLDDQVLRFMKVGRDMKEPMGWFPLRVHFELRYWQRNTVVKTVINGKVFLEDFTPLDDYYSPEHAAAPYDVKDVSNTWGLRGFQYDLRMTLVPVDWMEVLNTFALQASTYVIFYFVCDAAIVVLVMIVWAFFRGTTKHTSPPKLHLKEWFKGFELNPVKGMLMMFFPIATCCLVIRFVIGGMNPIKGLVAGDLNFEGTITEAIEERWMEGRIGICVLALGFNLMQNGAALLCPRKDKPGSVWLPGYWQRRHILYTSATLFVMLLMVLEFSFSRFFAQNALVFMMLFKVVWIYMESWLLKALNEKLIALPFECALQTSQFVMTLGAEGFIQFITSFVVELLIMIVKRVAMDPIKFKVVRTAKLKVKIAQAQKLSQPVPVHTPELEAIGVMIDMLQSMYRFSVDSLGTVISPMTIAVLYIFRKEYEISSLYGIRDTDLLYYMLFSIIMIPALWFVDIFLHNTLELVWNWKLFEYIEFCTERFRNRTRRWVGLDTAINEELPSDLRTLDQMCFSTQFYFLGALHASGIVMAVLGYMLVLHKGHNMCADCSEPLRAPFTPVRLLNACVLRPPQVW